MAFATANDMIQRFDARTIGRLISDDGNSDAPPDFQNNENLKTALSDASAEIWSALARGERYTRDEIENDLTDDGRFYLIRLTCELAFVNLWQRRDMPKKEESKYQQLYESSRAKLEELRTGAHVLEIASAQSMGHAQTDHPGIKVIEQEWGLLTSEMRRGSHGFFPDRRGPYNGRAR